MATPVTLQASTTATQAVSSTSTNPFANPSHSTPVDLGDASTLRLDLEVTAATLVDGRAPVSRGEVQLRVAIEHGPTADGPFVEVWPKATGTDHDREAAFVRETGTTRIVVGPCDQFARVRFVPVQGSVTFSVAGDAV